MQLSHLFLLLLVAVSVVAKPAAAIAQPPIQTEGDKMIEAYLADETDKLNKKFLDGAKTLQEWQQKRPELHRQYMEMLGLSPAPAKTPLKATVTGCIEHQGVLIENLHFQSVPGLYVTGNFYFPKGNTKKLPTILYVCGHSNKGRDGNKSAHQDHGMWFASNGYNCLVLDTLQLGEIPGVHHGTYGRPWLHLKAYGIDGKDKVENRWWWLARGYTPAGVECWNGIRGIDYLLTRDDVDADKIGVTGISGGGAATFWIAAADDRVKVAVPVSGMSDLQSYVKNKVVNGHCDCMFLINTYQWDWTTIAALVAPRPMLFANSDDDKIFPMDGNRRVIEKLRKLYTMYGQPDLVDDYVSVGGHAYRPDLRVAIFKFLNKHLKGDAKTAVKDADFQPIDAKKLRVFPTEADLPKDAINDKIDEVFVPKAKVKLPEKAKFNEWKKELTDQLTQKVFRGIADVPPAKMTFAKGIINVLETSKHREVGFFLTGLTGKEKGYLILDDAPKEKDIGKRGFAIVPYSLGSMRWTKKSPPNYVERSHALLGTTVDADAVRDIISSVRWLAKDVKITDVTLEGHGRLGILAAYAAIFEPSISEVVIVDPPTSHMQGPTFLNVLKVLDIPEALGMLAPRKLTLINAKDAAFDRTAEIYKLAGAADKLTRK